MRIGRLFASKFADCCVIYPSPSIALGNRNDQNDRAVTSVVDRWWIVATFYSYKDSTFANNLLNNKSRIFSWKPAYVESVPGKYATLHFAANICGQYTWKRDEQRSKLGRSWTTITTINKTILCKKCLVYEVIETCLKVYKSIFVQYFSFAIGQMLHGKDFISGWIFASLALRTSTTKTRFHLSSLKYTH